MEMFVKDIRKDIKKTFNNDDFEKEKKVIKQEYDNKRERLLEQLNKRTVVQGFEVKSTANGVYMMPVLDGKPLAEDEFEALDENVKKEFEERSELVQEQVFEALAQMKAVEKEAETKIEEWQSNVALLTINVHINSVKANYKRNKIIGNYLENVKKELEDRFGHIDENLNIYMHEIWFEKLAKKYNIYKVNKTNLFVELVFNKDITEKLDMQKLFVLANDISFNFKFNYIDDKLRIKLMLGNLDKHYIYYLTDLLSKFDNIMV